MMKNAFYFTIKDPHREKVIPYKTPTPSKRQESKTETKFSKKEGVTGKTPFF